MTTVELRNDFHHSAVRVRATGLLSEVATRRVYRELCGIRECTCGGIRGPQDGLPEGYCADRHQHPTRLYVGPVDAV